MNWCNESWCNKLMVGSGLSFWHFIKIDRHFMWSSSVSLTNYDKKVTCLPNQEKIFFVKFILFDNFN
jgi:hypothetical protein